MQVIRFAFVSAILFGLAAPISAQCELAAVTDSSGYYFQYFGQSVSTAGTLAVVGAPRYGASNSEIGAGYIYVYSGGAWSLDVSLHPTTLQSGDHYGQSVATDGERVVVGAPFDDTDATNAGAIFIYRKASGFWVREAKLTAGNGVASQVFGWSVAISGTRVAVGGPGPSSQTGKVFTFKRSGTTWTAEATLTPSASFTIKNCGKAVSLDGDWLIAGSEDSNPGSYGHPDGAAFIFQYTSSWAQNAAVTSPQTTPHGRFGISVALNGSSLAIGAPWENSTPTSNGGGYVHAYSLSGSTWSLQQSIAPYDIEANEYFGWSVALNGSGLIAGSILKDVDDQDTGAVYSYVVNGSSWKQRSRLKGSDTVFGDLFGSSASLSGDFIIVGAEARDTYKGGAYIFSRCP